MESRYNDVNSGRTQGQKGKIFAEIADAAKRLARTGDYSPDEIADECVSKFVGRYDAETVRNVVQWTVR